MQSQSTRRIYRRLALVLAGGITFQFAGCAAGLAPVAVSIAESMVLWRLLDLPKIFP